MSEPLTLTSRLATMADIPVLAALMRASIDTLQNNFLDEQQITASHSVMGLDTQLIADKTYFCVTQATVVVGCGGWSDRATLYGGDHSAGRDAARLDPAIDAARIRAMYTHPDYARRGIGRMVLSLCEAAARSAGFRRAELMATLSGEPLYRACGFEPVEHITDGIVPLIRMGKDL